MRIPGLLALRNDDNLSTKPSSSGCWSGNGSDSSSSGFWSKNWDELSYSQLQKFWRELSLRARQDVLKIDKHTLMEQARKTMYCSRCNGLLHEGFMQIIAYGKSLKPQGAGRQLPHNRLGISKDQMLDWSGAKSVSQAETEDPLVHPWGGLIATRDGGLTLLDCYLYSKSLKALQNVFNSARTRERKRELLYPDACGRGSRVWVSQGVANYGRGHGTRETCALHTARISCDALVDFWSALGEETRQSLLRMKEEDFIDRLMCRFDSKRFCQDCRRNVLREFKKLKELKRMRREPWCTSWFCGTDGYFQYEVSSDTVRADWHQMLIDSVGTYHHFEWAVGSGQGNSDILEFENVGMNGSVQVNGLDLGGLSACYITLRAWRLDGQCTEFSVKALALKGRQCVHCRLEVGDGYVKVTCGESIRRFFEHAEEFEEEEDDDSMDKNGNDMDGECSRPRKHAKSPELARDFLVEAATVIFKEQVEKAFREGTARQSAHSTLICLALKLLEERIHIACKEIITLEKQMKLLEEEEKEKRAEEEHKKRKKTKEKEKKLRRKERLRGKDKDKKCCGSSQTFSHPDGLDKVLSPCLDEEASCSYRDSMSESSDIPAVLDESSSNGYTASDVFYCCDDTDGELLDVKEGNGFLSVNDGLRCSRRKSIAVDRCRSTETAVVGYDGVSLENHSKGVNCWSRQSRAITSNFNNKSSLRFNQKVQCSNNHIDCINVLENFGRHKGKINYSSNTLGRDLPRTKKVWEPVELQKRYPLSNSDSDITSRLSSLKTERFGFDKPVTEVGSCGISKNLDGYTLLDSTSSKSRADRRCHDDFPSEANDEEAYVTTSSCNLNGISDFCASSSSSSDNCWSCPSEEDSSTPSSSHPSVESSSSSDSEDSSQLFEVRASLLCIQNGLSKACGEEKIKNIEVEEGARLTQAPSISSHKAGNHLPWDSPIKTSQKAEEANIPPGMTYVQQSVLPPFHNPNISFPVSKDPTTVGYYHQSPIAWSTALNGFVTYPQPNHYLLTSSPLGYEMSFGDSPFGLHHGRACQLASYFLSPNRIPVYQQASRSDCLHPQEQTSALKANKVRDPSGEPRTEAVVPTGTGCGQPEVHPMGGSEKGNLTTSGSGNTCFSLFQFGSPVAVALPTYKSNLLSSDQGKSGYISCCQEGGHTYSKRENSIGEYNLFATNNGIQFSIF